MSLLLDALKKAAQDKQKASSLEKEGIQSPARDEEKAMEAEKVPENIDTSDDIELELDELPDDESPADNRPNSPSKNKQPEKELTLEDINTGNTPVSDQALHLLIYKANNEYRRSQKRMWAGLLTGSLLLLLAGGYYYYDGMMQEVESLERKHAIAMRSVKKQAVDSDKQANPNLLISNAAIEEVRNTEVGKDIAPKKAEQPKQVSPYRKASQSKPVLSFQRTHKEDPVNTMLLNAWEAYNVADYNTSAELYKKVLLREPLNRDAWLGEAAIAMKQGSWEQARRAYARLLDMNPRDEIAIAGLASLEQGNVNTLSESRLKFMLQQKPDAAHIHFALGNYYAKQSRWSEAQKSYFSAWQYNSENADYMFNLAVSLDQLGKAKEAEKFYEKSLEFSKEQNVSFSIQTVQERLNRTAQ